MMFMSQSRQVLMILTICAISSAINRPVYKIILNSKGYAQFIQYDLNIPPFREFTLCVWVRVTNLGTDQTLYTYIGDDDKRIMRLRLNSGGQQLTISINHDRVISSAAVEFTKNVWRDVCLSYQADYGAWALYVDAQLVMCEASRSLQGFEFPGEGSLIFGYGTSEKGLPTGLSGEIYGASMILISTIERNNTKRKEPWERRNTFQKNQIPSKNKQEDEFIVLGNLQTDELKTVIPLPTNKKHESFPPSRHQQLRDNKLISSNYSTLISTLKPKKLHDFSIDEYHRSIDEDINKYSSPSNKDHVFKEQHEFKKELSGSSTHDLPIVLEYETPPAITASTGDYSAKNTEKGKSFDKDHNLYSTISEVDKPPPPEYDTKVYGQWTSSKFVSNVLNYLKSINYNTNKKQKKVLPAFPVVKFSDSYPYSSEFAYTRSKIRPPLNYKKIIHPEKYHIIKRRDINKQQINVEIITTDESDILDIPNKNPDIKLVEVTNRGEPKNQLINKSFTTTENNTSFESAETSDVSQTQFQKRQSDVDLNSFDRHRGNNLMDILPFLKSKDYFANFNLTKNTETNQIYTKTLSNANKWHNVKSYNNDFTPQLIIDFEPQAKMSDVLISNRHQAGEENGRKFGIQYKPELHQQMKLNNVQSIINGRALAKEVSSRSAQNILNSPLLKFKHGDSSTHDSKITTKYNNEYKVTNKENYFHRHVKLGNALNEQFIDGFDEHQIKNTFLDGDDTIPDIIRHRSKWNSKSDDIPSSLGIRTCKNVELYVQQDESIGKSKIVSPVQQRNIGVEFIVQSYKTCSMKDSSLKDSPLLLIDWVKTPVKLFGGAYPKKTKDLCGFF